jgi:hypothetical protein
LLTPDQITAIAPDATSLKAGRDIGTPRKWEMTGGDSEFLWGLAIGSGKSPYQSIVSLSDLTTKCSCPSRKFPCKHALGLMFLAISAPPTPSERPLWVAEWVAARAARAEKSQAATKETSTKLVDEKAAAKRRQQREERVMEGVALLRQSIIDLTTDGLAGGNARNPDYWKELAKRMIDCQAPGLAGIVGSIGDTVLYDAEVDTELPYELGRLHLLLHSLENADRYPDSTQADMRNMIGGRSNTSEQAGEVLEDDWFIAARKVDERENLITSTTWLYGKNSQRWARILRFSPAHLPLSEPWIVGSAVRVSLQWEQGSYPLRATPVTESPSFSSSILPHHEAGLDDMLERFARAIAANPFLLRLPFLIALQPSADGMHLLDATGHALPWAAKRDIVLRVECISGGHPTLMCGEWDGRSIRLLSLCDAGTWISLTTHHQ